MSYESLRNDMVDTQLIPRGIKGKRVLEAMRKVPRHLFVPDRQRDVAYGDFALPIGEGQTISQPYMVAIMTELLNLTGSESVLEIGTGSGYQAAILGELAGKVYTVERVKPLSESAAKLLSSLGYENIEVIQGDGTAGLAEKAPFDGIIVTAACPEIPSPLLEQLAEGGRLIAPVGSRFQQVLARAVKSKGKVKIEKSIGCVFVPLVGKFSWKG